MVRLLMLGGVGVVSWDDERSAVGSAERLCPMGPSEQHGSSLSLTCSSACSAASWRSFSSKSPEVDLHSSTCSRSARTAPSSSSSRTFLRLSASPALSSQLRACASASVTCVA